MAVQSVVECYAVLVDPFNSLRSNGTRHRGADYRRAAGQPVVAYEKIRIVNSDLYSSFLGYCVVGQRIRDGQFVGWAHLRVGTRPANGAILEPGGQVGLVAGYGQNPGSSWTGPHIHTTEGPTANHIFSGTVTDPNPDIQAARGSSSGGVNYGWYQLSAAAQSAIQRLLNAQKIYGGVVGATGPVDGKLGPNGVKGMQYFLRRAGYLPADYEIDGVPHNADQSEPSNYGYALQRWAAKVAGYPGQIDGLPAALSSEYIVKAADKVIGGTPTPPPPPAPVVVPVFPPVPEGFVFMPDLATSQSTFDFVEYRAKGGAWAALKMGGANTSDAPYVAPAYADQVSRARAAGVAHLVHYWFNGAKNGLTPEQCADYYAEHALIRAGDVAAIDVEAETATGTVAWSPEEAVRFVKRLREWFPGIRGLAYMSDSVADAGEWDELAALGWELWNASWGANGGDPGTPPSTDDWARYFVWQYSSNEKVPGNYRIVNGVKEYQPTDGNLARADLFSTLGWVVPTDPEPEPDPVAAFKAALAPVAAQLAAGAASLTAALK